MANDPETRIDPALWDLKILEEIGSDRQDASVPAPSSVAGPTTVAPDPVQAAASPADRTAGARPARFRLKLQPAQEESDALLNPEKIRSWMASFGMHVLLLVLLAIIVFTPNENRPPSIDTRLPAGDPRGSDLGQQFTGGLGIDDPLAMPYAEIEAEKTIEPALAVPEMESLAPDLASRAAPAPADASAAGGGTALTGAGQAGSGDGFGVAKFGLGGSEVINNIEVRVGNPQFTLIWNSTADIDLHVLEPGGSHISWENRNGTRGGELDVDDVDGLGPENVYWGGGLNKGNGPPGEYKWYVFYYGGVDGNVPTRWKVRLKHGGAYKIFEGRMGAIGQRSKIYTFVIEGDSGGASLEPSDEAPRMAREGEAEDFERPVDERRGGGEGSFENPRSAPAGRGRRFGGAGVEMPEEGSSRPRSRDGEAPATSERTASAPAAAGPAARPTSRAPGTMARDASGWAIVEPAGAGYRAVMPVEPVEERRALEDRPGQPDVWLWSLDRGEGEYVVAYLDLSEELLKEGTEARLDAEAQALVREAGGSNVTLKRSPWEGKPARLVEFDVPERLVAGGGRCRLRLVLDGKRLFRVSVTGSSSFVDRSDSTRFFDSFRLQPASAAP
jgi:hypothetical protein